MPEKPFQPARTMREVKREAKLEALPPGDPRYVDLNDARGRHVVRDFLSHLDTGPDEYVHIAYAGHRGSGKTTELKCLLDRLGEQKIYPVYRDVQQILVMQDLTFSDILLYILQMAVEGVAEKFPVNEALLEPVVNWFADVTQINKEEIAKEIQISGEAEVGYAIPFLGKFVARVMSRIQGRTSDVTEIRQRLQKRPEELIQKVNEVFTALTVTVGPRCNRILLVVDSLDKLAPEAIDSAFIQYARFYNQLKANLIFTVPISHIYRPLGEPLDTQGFEIVTLPMVPLRSKGQQWTEHNDDTVGLLMQVVSKRVDVAAVFTDQAILKDMALMSGGSLRDLLRLLYHAALQSTAGQIDRESYEEGKTRLFYEFTAPICYEDYPRLLEIHKRRDFDRTEDQFRLLYFRFALEYNHARWADVHPLLYYSENFQKLLQEKP